MEQRVTNLIATAFNRLLSMSPRNGSCVAEVSSVRSLSSDDVSASKTHRKKSCWARATDPAHRRGRRIQLLQMLVLPFIPILALIVQTANTLHDILIYRQEVSDIESQVRELPKSDSHIGRYSEPPREVRSRRRVYLKVTRPARNNYVKGAIRLGWLNNFTGEIDRRRRRVRFQGNERMNKYTAPTRFRVGYARRGAIIAAFPLESRA